MWNAVLCLGFVTIFPLKGSSWAGFMWEKKSFYGRIAKMQNLTGNIGRCRSQSPLAWFQFFHQTQFASYCRSPTPCSCPFHSLTSTLLVDNIAIYDNRADLTILKVVIHFKSYQAFSMFFSFFVSCTHSYFCPLPLQGEVPPGSSSAWGGAMGGIYSLQFWAWHHQVGINEVHFSCPV